MFNIISKKQHEELQADRDSLVQKCQGLETEIENLKKMSVEMTDKQAQHDNVIATMKAEHEKATTELKANYDKTISELNEKVKVEANASEAKAIQTLSKIGVPVEELPQATKENPLAILDGMSGLSATQLSEYFTKNKKAVFDALRVKAANNKKV